VPNLLTATAASVVFGNFVALDQVSAAFHPGEVTLLMGASGSGKTTLLALLGFLRSPDSGRIELLGENLSAATESRLVALRRKHIGFVFQAFRLFPALNALENVMMPLRISGGASRTAAMELLASVGMTGKDHLYPAQMSGGERQRVAVARALIKNPAIILADEPTASLDSVAGGQVAGLLQSASKQRGCSTIIATHDARLLPIADRTLNMSDGKIQERGTADERR
jgi:putative ABC transport system ATP-binding protein